MLALDLIRNNTEEVRRGLANKGENSATLDNVLGLDQQRRAILGILEDLRKQVNDISRLIGSTTDQPLRKRLIAQSKDSAQKIGPLETQLSTVNSELSEHLLTIPNLPHKSVPIGQGAEENKQIKREGELQEFDFEPRDHIQLATGLGILDVERARKISGSGFWLHTGIGAKLQRVLISWMLDVHTNQHNYTEIYAPALVRSDAMIGTGQLPKFASESYRLEKDDLWLAPTAEVPVTNIHREEILPNNTLPIRYAAYTPCFRRESGAAGTETRGLLRVHQFDKVELVHFVEPNNSYEEQLLLLSNAETILQELELPYRVIELCTGDLSAAAAKCFDIELWAPGTNRWLEVSSVSNFEDYQARRARIRYRPDEGARPRFVHTLNGSGVALPRLTVAILENYQQEDGSIVVPRVLRDALGCERVATATS
jgi:seryl-tRNA synthetase